MTSYKFKSITKKYLSQIGISNFYQDLVFQWIIIIYVFYSFMAYSIEIYSYTTIYSNPGAFTSWVSIHDFLRSTSSIPNFGTQKQ